MWPFKDKEKERADKLENQLQELIEREKIRDEREIVRLEEEEVRREKEEIIRLEKEEVQRGIDEAIEEANRTSRLADEEKERKDAEKTLATEKGEPWVNIVSMEMEPGETANIGAIEMDWNEHFVKMLQKNGYVGVSDEDAVDQWFRDVCRHVVLETYEDEEAESGKIERNDLGDGRAEYS